MKGRLHEPPLPQPERTAACNQPIAEHALQKLHRPALDEMPVLGHQHLLDQLGIANQHRFARPEFQSNHRTMLAGAIKKKP
jgi:hypothetical protein